MDRGAWWVTVHGVAKRRGLSWWFSGKNNLPAKQKMWVQSLDWEDPLEKEIPNHSSILAWEIPVDRGSWQATIHGVARVGHDSDKTTTYIDIKYARNITQSLKTKSCHLQQCGWKYYA